jgi:hypothetical protein
VLLVKAERTISVLFRTVKPNAKECPEAQWSGVLEIESAVHPMSSFDIVNRAGL